MSCRVYFRDLIALLINITMFVFLFFFFWLYFLKTPTGRVTPEIGTGHDLEIQRVFPL